MVTTKYKLRFNKDHFEKRAWQESRLVCGIDEVGRSCLAGPVMVAAVILKHNKKSRLLKDSKLLTKEERVKGYNWIIKNSWYATAAVHNRGVDKHNIYFATLIAMKRAFMQLMAECPFQPESVLVDAMPLDLKNSSYENIDVFHFPFGEKKSSSIAAASIVAKVTRDEMMKRFEGILPGYHLYRNKGYATPQHKKELRQTEYSIIHRLRFLETYHLGETNRKKKNDEEQQSLC